MDTAPAAPANVVWAIQYKKQSVGDNFNFVAGTTTLVSVEAVTIGTPANDMKIHGVSLILTTTDWVEADIVHMRLYRDADHANDTFVGDARVHAFNVGIEQIEVDDS